MKISDETLLQSYLAISEKQEQLIKKIDAYDSSGWSLRRRGQFDAACKQFEEKERCEQMHEKLNISYNELKSILQNKF